MSDVSSTRLGCPSCSHEEAVTVYHSVNVTHNPELKTPLLQQDLTRHRCSHCGAAVPVIHDLLYHDMQRRLMIQLTRREGAPGSLRGCPEGYTLRSVASPHELIEKVLAADGDLDDRAVEVVKYGICHELLAAYSDPLAKFNALPLNPDRILLLDKTSVKSGGGDGERLLFLFLLAAPPAMCVLCLMVPLASYRAAEERLRRQPSASVEPGRWHRIDFAWAKKTLGPEAVPVGVEMLVIPEFVQNHPIAKSIWEKHVESLRATDSAAKPASTGGLFGRIKGLFGRRG